MISPIEIENACKSGDLEVIKTASENKKIKWNRKNSSGETYTDIAIKHKRFEIVKKLVELKCLYNPEFSSILEDLGLVGSIKSNQVSSEYRRKIQEMSYNLMRAHTTTLLDIKEHISKYGHVVTCYNGANVIDELLNYYCSGMDRKYYGEECGYFEYFGYSGHSNNKKVSVFEFKHDLEIINYLISEHNANVNSTLYDNTPLISAVQVWSSTINKGRSELESKAIVDLLLEKKADINQYSEGSIYVSPLGAVLKYGDKKNIVKNADYLVSKGADPKRCMIKLKDIHFNEISLKWYVDNGLYRPDQGTQILGDVCYYGSSNAYHYLINNVQFSEDIKSNNFNGKEHSLLHDVCSASEYNDNAYGAKTIPMIEDLINNRGISVDIKDKDGHTCLYYAIRMQNLYAVQYLINDHQMIVTEEDLKIAILPNLSNSDRKSSIHNILTKRYNETHTISVSQTSFETIVNFCSHGPSKIFDNWCGSSYTTVKDNIQIMNRAIENLSPEKYTDVFEMLCKNGLYEVADNLKKLSIKKGFGKIKIKNDTLIGEICSSPFLNTPIRVSCCLGDWIYPFDKTLELLFDNTTGHKVDPNVTFNGLTPLQILCNNKNASYNQIEILIKNGADVDAVDENGYTPLFYAKKKHNFKDYKGEQCNNIVELLIREGAENYGKYIYHDSDEDSDDDSE